MAANKEKVIRGKVSIRGSLDSGAGDEMLTRDNTTKQVGLVPAGDSSSYVSSTLQNGYILIGNDSNIATPRSLSGMISISNTGVTSVIADTIMDVHINAAANISYSKLTLTNSIINNDIAPTAGITRSKLASGNNYRILINNASGVMSEASAITANRVLVSDGNGIPTASSVTTTQWAYYDPSSSIQTQLNNRLSFSSGITPVAGDLVFYSGSNWVALARGTTGQVLTATPSTIQWAAGTSNGLTPGGSTAQLLRKIDNTDYNAEWFTLTTADISDITASAAQINVLATGYYDATGSIQTQLDHKLTADLAYNAMFVGNAANLATQLATGSDGTVLTSVAGVPQWVTPSPPGDVSGVGSSTDNAIVRWNGTTADSIQNSSVIIDDTNNISGAVNLTMSGTLTLSTAPANDNALTQVLVRDSGTGVIKYKASSSFAGALSGTTGRVTIWTSSSTIGDDSAFTYNSTDDILTVPRVHLTAQSSDVSATVIDGDVFYQSTVLDLKARINSEWINLTRPNRRTITGSSGALVESDRNGIIYVNNTTDPSVPITIPTGLSDNYQVTVVKLGTADVILTPAGGVTLTSYDDTISVQHAAATVFHRGSNTFSAFGGLGSLSGGSLTDGNGTTANSTAVDLGGTLTATVDIDGAQIFRFGNTTPLDSFALNTANDAVFVIGGALTQTITNTSVTNYLADYQLIADSNLGIQANSDISIVAITGAINFASDTNPTFSINGDVGSSGDVLGSDGAGGFTWVAGGGGGISGSGTSGQVAYWNGTSSITSEAGFEYDAANNRLITDTLRIGSTAVTGDKTIDVASSSTNAALILTPKGVGSLITTSQQIDFGTTSVAGSSRVLYAKGSSTNVSLDLVSQGAGSTITLRDASANWSFNIGQGSYSYANNVGQLYSQVTGSTALFTIQGDSLLNFVISSRDGSVGSINGQPLSLSGGFAYDTSGNGNGGNLNLASGTRRIAGSGLDGNVTIDYKTGNLALGSPTGSFGSAKGAIFIADVTTAPSGSHTGGGIFYSDSTAHQLMYKTPDGFTNRIRGSFWIPLQGTTVSFNDATTYYMGTHPNTPTTSAAIRQIYFPVAATIKCAEVYTQSVTAGSSESWEFFVRKNNTTDTSIATVSSSAGARRWTNTSLSIDVDAGDYVEIKTVTPTWATNPATTVLSGHLYCELR